MTFATDLRSFEAGLAARVAAAFHSIAEAHEKRRDFNRTLRELRALDNAALADLGIDPWSIAAVAHDAVYGPRG